MKIKCKGKYIVQTLAAYTLLAHSNFKKTNPDVEYDDAQKAVAKHLQVPNICEVIWEALR